MAWPLGHAWSPTDHPKVKSKQTSKRHPQAALLAEGRTDPGLQWALEPGPFQGSPAFLLSLSGSLPLASNKVPRLSISGKALETHGRHCAPVISWETHQSVSHSSDGDNHTLPLTNLCTPFFSRLKQRPQGRQKVQCPPPHLTGQHYSSRQLGFLLYNTRPLCFQPPGSRVPRPQTPHCSSWRKTLSAFGALKAGLSEQTAAQRGQTSLPASTYTPTPRLLPANCHPEATKMKNSCPQPRSSVSPRLHRRPLPEDTVPISF